jgi:hypothetical protein
MEIVRGQHDEHPPECLKPVVTLDDVRGLQRTVRDV